MTSSTSPSTTLSRKRRPKNGRGRCVDPTTTPRLTLQASPLDLPCILPESITLIGHCAGIYDYADRGKYNPPITDGTVSEYSKAMGPRTRFGDGDGSFWDKWVGAGNEQPGKGLGYDGNRVPMQRCGRVSAYDISPPSFRHFRSGSIQPKMGFKRYYKTLAGELPQSGVVKSYSQRRAERLERY